MRFLTGRSCFAVKLAAWVALSLSATSTFGDENEFFERKIRPIFVEHCYKCHSHDAEKIKGGLVLDSRAGLLKGGDNGPVIIPGNPGRSLLIKAVRYTDPDLKMPPKNQRLSETQIADLEAWVKMVAPDPRPDRTASRAEANRQHWAFQPLRQASVPSVKNKSWVKTPVDAFILAKLEVNKLKPAPQADKRTLLRRVTYDLTGLPPTFAEVEAFVKDRSPDAFSRVVDRLLRSPRYGERWGRYWLDVARYADTKGYVYGDREEKRFVHSYAYRDWVVRAFNDDMPYDRFLRLQIAADQMADAGRDALAAMGFLTLGRRFLGVTHDIIDDRIDVLTRGTLGLTVSCARCHDHKFDPIPTRDYYSAVRRVCRLDGANRGARRCGPQREGLSGIRQGTQAPRGGVSRVVQ
jgi:mono/diheme cytochrome c family protein